MAARMYTKLTYFYKKRGFLGYKHFTFKREHLFVRDICEVHFALLETALTASISWALLLCVFKPGEIIPVLRHDLPQYLHVISVGLDRLLLRAR